MFLCVIVYGLDLRVMFDPITPLEFKPPAEKRPGVPLAGVASLLTNFETTPPPERKPFIPPVEAKKLAQERLQKLHQEKNELLVQDWDPHNNPKATGNAFATVFVSRLSYDTNEKKLRRDFEIYGPIRSIRVVHDTEGKSRGYAFIEYETEKDAEAAVRKSEGKRIEGRRIVCDVERGRYVHLLFLCCSFSVFVGRSNEELLCVVYFRTVKNWRPMRFGGGMGGRPAKKSKKTLEEEAMKAATVSGGTTTAASEDYRGGDRGGDRGDRGGGDRGGGDRGRGGRSRSRDRRGGGGDRDRDRSRDRDHYRGGDRDRERDRDAPRGGGGGDRDRDRGGDRHHSRERGPPPPRERERDAYGGGYGSSRGGGSSGGGGGGYYGPAGGGSNGGGSRRDNSRDRGGGGGGPRGRSRDRR